MRLTFGRHHPGTKIAEEETHSIPHCSAAATGVPQRSGAWNGPQQSYRRRARKLEGKPHNRNTSSEVLGPLRDPIKKSATTQTTGG